MDSTTVLSISLLTTMICFIEVTGSLDLRDMLCSNRCENRTCPSIRAYCEMVPEPGYCWCCLKCAKEEGEHCGLLLGRCRRGMTCEPLPGESGTKALFSGRAVCRRVRPKPKVTQRRYMRLHGNETFQTIKSAF